MLIKRVQEKIAELDKNISYQFYRLSCKTPMNRKYLRFLEYSCHGIPWFMIVSLCSYLSSDKDFWINFLIGLLFDIAYIAIAKALFRRRRPVYAPENNHTWTVGVLVDKLSFPSGHASRSVYVALVFCHSWFTSVIWVWTFSVIVSRVLYGKHFIGDVLAGSFVGYFNYITQFTIFFPIHSFVKWFMMSMVFYETIIDN